MTKRLYLLLSVFLLLCNLAVPGLAAQTEVPLRIAGTTYYDPEEKTFLYYVDNTSMLAVRSSAADKMVTAQAVTVRADAGVALEVYLDGTRLEGVSGGTYRQPGEYVVMYIGGTVSQRIFSFTIVPQLCNSVSSYALPAGFEITGATLDGENVPYERNYIKLTGEGEYDIRYVCTKTDVPYQLTFRTDYTGPVLALKEVTEGTARGPVDISDAGDAAVVNIYRDGQKITRKDILTESGEYFIELMDEAGNKTTYSFTILIYFDGNSWLFFCILLFSAVAVLIYLIYSRKHLRVR